MGTLMVPVPCSRALTTPCPDKRRVSATPPPLRASTKSGSIRPLTSTSRPPQSTPLATPWLSLASPTPRTVVILFPTSRPTREQLLFCDPNSKKSYHLQRD